MDVIKINTWVNPGLKFQKMPRLVSIFEDIFLLLHRDVDDFVVFPCVFVLSLLSFHL